jgi:hypothetical protein
MKLVWTDLKENETVDNEEAESIIKILMKD